MTNTKMHFGTVAILFHWIMAVLIIGLLCVGLYMVTLPIGLEKLKLYGWHKQIGVLVLMLVSLRLIWRLSNLVPVLNLSPLERFAAQAVHLCLYLLMIAMPMSGWLMSSAAGFPVSFFGWFHLPNLLSADEQLRHLFATVHGYLAYTLIALISLHTLAALKHHFITKDDILRRMWL